ncbi:MAG: hypothetical protein HKN23_20165 [Verrucomicrobiales bacterium]|nr:hypothetical protein [Verrucomicrobiales bacterium]
MELKGPQRLFFSAILCVISFSGLREAEGQASYPKPDYEAMAYPKDGIGLDDVQKSELLTALAAVARNFDDVSNRTRAQAVAIARRIDPLHKPSFVADYQLNRGVKPKPVEGVDSLEAATQSIYANSKRIALANSIEKTQLSGFLISLVSELNPDDPVYVAALKAHRSTSGEILWDPIIPDLKPVASSTPGRAISSHTFGFLSTSGVFQIESKAQKTGDSNALGYSGGEKLGTGIFSSAFREGVKHLGQKRGETIRGIRIAFDTSADFDKDFFEEQGPAAALPCVNSLLAVLENRDLSKNIALAGDVNADGTIQPVHDIRERLLNLESDSSGSIIGIPSADTAALGDILLLHGPKVFVDHQVFGIKKLPDAVRLTKPELDRAENLNSAISKFEQVQSVLRKPGGMKLISNSHVLTRLREVVNLAPNHLSARMLGRWGTNRLPGRLSLSASLEVAMSPLEPILDGNSLDDNSTKELEPTALARLKRFNTRLDARLNALGNAVLAYSNAGRVGTDKAAARKRAAQRLKDELAAMARDIDIREEMMR